MIYKIIDNFLFNFIAGNEILSNFAASKRQK